MVTQWSKRLYHKIMRCSCGSRCETHCWEWQGYRDVHGYGRTRTVVYGRQETYIHRVALSMALGRVLLAEACHTCDNPPCCNDVHLFEGTHRENLLDSLRKGRWKPGEWGIPQKLTVEQVRLIRRWHRETTEPQRVIAAELGVSQPLVSRIIARRVWKGVLD